jgi:Arc/MetJ-type ribon-helix-helix transcriptional regulator
MLVELTPEDERLVRKRLESGAFQSAGEVIHEALAAQEVENAWLEENKALIDDKIRRGIAQLDAGQGIPGDLARERLQQRKAQWLRGHKD